MQTTIEGLGFQFTAAPKNFQLLSTSTEDGAAGAFSLPPGHPSHHDLFGGNWQRSSGARSLACQGAAEVTLCKLKLSTYRGYIGITEKKMETSI